MILKLIYRGFSGHVHNFWPEIKDVFLGVVVFFFVPNSILALISEYQEENSIVITPHYSRLIKYVEIESYIRVLV